MMGNKRPRPCCKENPRIFVSKSITHLTSLDLRHTIQESNSDVEVINRYHGSALVDRFGEKLVGESEIAWQCLVESCSKTDFEEKLHERYGLQQPGAW